MTKPTKRRNGHRTLKGFSAQYDRYGWSWYKGILLDLLGPKLIRRWLKTNPWIREAGLACTNCPWATKVIHHRTSDVTCLENVTTRGATCYRWVLRTTFLPFLENALRGKFPPVSSIRGSIYPYYRSTEDPGSLLTLEGMILYELDRNKLKPKRCMPRGKSRRKRRATS
jgi:hypothetical protein